MKKNRSDLFLDIIFLVRTKMTRELERRLAHSDWSQSSSLPNKGQALFKLNFFFYTKPVNYFIVLRN